MTVSGRLSKMQIKVQNVRKLTWSMTVWGRLSASMSRTKQSAPESSRLSRRQARTFLIRIDLEVNCDYGGGDVEVLMRLLSCCETGH